MKATKWTKNTNLHDLCNNFICVEILKNWQWEQWKKSELFLLNILSLKFYTVLKPNYEHICINLLWLLEGKLWPIRIYKHFRGFKCTGFLFLIGIYNYRLNILKISLSIWNATWCQNWKCGIIIFTQYFKYKTRELVKYSFIPLFINGTIFNSKIKPCQESVIEANLNIFMKINILS